MVNGLANEWWMDMFVDWLMMLIGREYTQIVWQ